MASAKSLTKMFIASFLFVIIQFSLYNIMNTEARITNEMLDTFFPSESAPSQKWAMLVAGSKDYMNYRHQADICHAWQTLTDKGVPKENIVVFMYDDIANGIMNPNQGALVNFPPKSQHDFVNVYEGVTKDYVGSGVNSDNVIAAFLGRATGANISAAMGKFIDSGPNDYIFFYYSGHGEVGALGMPEHGDKISKELFKGLLKQKQEYQGFKQMKKNDTSATTATKYETIRQDEIEIFYLKGMVSRAKMGSVEKEDAKKQLDDVISHRKHVDQSVIAIVRVIVDSHGHGQSSDAANATTISQVLKGNIDANTWDWKCFKGMVASYQEQCGTLRFYGGKYNQVFAKLCDIGITPKQLGVAARQICPPHSVKPQWLAEKKAGFYESPYLST